MLDRLYTKFDALADKYGVYKLETIGDGLLLSLPLCFPSHQEDADQN